ncbi:MAG: hypothetical protein HYX60_11410 [Legionella longbeachae]|nr:hypothetical protein [Legionella longbeachae]
MLKKILYSSVASLLIFAVEANAMKLNLILGNDIKTNKDSINLSYDIYEKSGPGRYDIRKNSFSTQGILLDSIDGLVAAFFSSDVHPTNNFDGKPSQITLGYIKNGAKIFPSSCQRIILKETTTIRFNENGCSVN